MASAPPLLNLPADALDELLELARGAESLSAIVTATEAVPPAVGVTAIVKAVAARLGAPTGEIASLAISLLNFYRTSVRLNASLADTAEAVGANIARSSKVKQRERMLEEWNRSKGLIVEAASRLSADHPLEASSKAFRVATSRQYGLADLSIFADVRPVFDDAAEKIVQTVITYVLSIDYQDCHEHKNIQFALDAEDVANLKEACERAERKASVIKRDLKAMSWPTSVFREPEESKGSRDTGDQ